jgi:thymidylate synthase
MYVIPCRNVNDAWPEAINVIQRNGTRQDTRNGPALVAPFPVCTMYTHPTECVLLDPIRDSNPFFSVMESLWMLAGRDDATFLDQFVSDFSARFAEPNGRMYGAYGYRWRNNFLLNDSTDTATDQLDAVVDMLWRDKQTRQAVIQMWDPELDLGPHIVKDRPCNLSISLRADRGVLDMLVNCRSNDIVYGAYGANAVHFSLLQQYLAARIGIPVGIYHQVSFNWHMYENTTDHVDRGAALLSAQEPYPGTVPLVDHPESFDEELDLLLAGSPWEHHEGQFRNKFLSDTALPLWRANSYRREKQYDKALATASTILAPDWRAAAVAWLQRRAARHEEKQHG